MTTFLIWPLTDDAAFRAAYLALTGEHVQEFPHISQSGERLMVGSNRVEASECAQLAAAFPALAFGPDPISLGWIAAVEDATL